MSSIVVPHNPFSQTDRGRLPSATRESCAFEPHAKWSRAQPYPIITARLWLSGLLVVSWTERCPERGGHRSGPAGPVDVHDGVAASHADTGWAQDLPGVADRTVADAVDGQLNA